MEKTGILIAQPTASFAQEISIHLQDSYRLYQCRDGIQTWSYIQQYCPFVLVMDLSLPGVDGLEILRRLQQVQKRPKVLLTTCVISSYLEANIGDYNVDMLMVRPCSAKLVAERVRELMGEPVQERPESQYRPLLQTPEDDGISAMLLRLSVSPKRKGYEYLQDCVTGYLEKPCQSVTKQLYPQVAKKHGTNPTAVERAIRQAIHAAWEVRHESIWREYFMPGRDGIIARPSNAAFIAQLAEYQRVAGKV